MEDYPRSTRELEERFATDEACREYLFKLRWPDGFRCPRCEGREAWPLSRDLHECAICGFQTSVTAGTLFQDTKKPLSLWFRAIWYVVGQKKGVSALGLQRAIGLGSYRTAWTWLHKLRLAMVRSDRDRLSGTVEVDETYIGGEKPGGQGHVAAGRTLVVVAVEDRGHRPGHVRLRRIADASAGSLTAALTDIVEPGSTLRTDGLSGYAALTSRGYAHSVVRQNADVGDHLLPLANQVAELLKRWLLETYQGAVRSSHLDYYLDEFTFRLNRRASRSRGMLFYRLVRQAVQVDPVPGKDIERRVRAS